MIARLGRYRVVLVVVGVFLGVFALLLLVVRPRDVTHDHSVYRKNAWGCAALAQLCREAEPRLEVHEITEPLDHLAATRGLLVILAPTEPFSDAELRELVRWVKAGGTLFVGVAGLWDDPSAERGGAGPPYVKLAAALGVAARQTPSTARTARPVPGSPLAAGVETVVTETRYTVGPLSSKGEAEGWAEEEFLNQPVDCLLPHGPQDLTAQLEADHGPILVSFRAGRGQVYFGTDPGLFDNGVLSRADNVALAANLIWPNAAGRNVYIDEYHHGFGERQAEATAVDPAPLSRAALVLLAGCVVFLIGQAIRFGAPVSAFDPRRRATMEYVEGLAALWRQAEARGPALRQIAATFRHRLAAAAAVRPTADPEQFAAALEARRGLPAEETATLLREVEAALSGPAVGQKDLARLVNRMTELEERALVRPSGSRRNTEEGARS